jgi:hypothetical protein
LVVKGHSVSGQRLKDISYVDLWAARDTDVKIRETKLDEIFEEKENAFARRRNTRGVGAFIKSVDHQINWTFMKCEHLF